MKKLSSLLCVLYLTLLSGTLFAQSRTIDPVQVLISPNKADWTYQVGEKASFTVTVLAHQVPIEGAEVRYEIGLEKMLPTQQGTIKSNGTSTMLGKDATLEEPGFLRCQAWVKVDGKEYRGIATAAFSPLKIKPTQTLPHDFQEFWTNAKEEAAKIPMDTKLTFLPERSNEKVDVYQVSIQNYELGARVYGILAKPKIEGKYPALLQVPGAGIRPYQGNIALAEQGVITLEIGIHGIPVTYEKELYNNLSGGALRGYNYFNLDDRDKYYYKRVYLGCVRAIDYIFSLEEFDGSNLAVYGGSQGGALSIVTAALDSRVKHLASFYPALSDLTGYLHGRAGGWPHMFTQGNASYLKKEDKINVSAYYDVVNFARSVKVPGFYSWGYNDETCPPTSIYAAYNLIQAPKDLYLVQETGHWTYPLQREKVNEWLLKQLKGN